jgi:hypothetical protein
MEKKFMYVVIDNENDVVGVFDTRELAVAVTEKYPNEIFNITGYELNTEY